MLIYGTVPTDPRVRKTYKTLSKFNILLHLICYSLVISEDLPSDITFHPQLQRETNFSGSSLDVVDLLSFWIYSVRRMFHINKLKKIDYIHIHDFTTLLPALVFKLSQWHTILIYDSHELAPEAAKEFFSIFHMIYAFVMEIVVIPFVSIIITVSPMQSVIMKQRYQRKVYTVRNLPERDELIQATREEGEEILQKNNIDLPSTQIKFIYASHISQNRGFDELITTWKKINNEFPNFVLLLAGDGPYLTKIRDDIKRTNNIYYLGYFNVEKYYSILAASDIGLCLIDPMSNLNNFIGYPNKITEYFAMNKFVISTKLLNFIKEISQGNCIMLDEFNVEELVEKIKSIKDLDIKQNTPFPLREEYLWENNISYLKEIYDLE